MITYILVYLFIGSLLFYAVVKERPALGTFRCLMITLTIWPIILGAGIYATWK
jgi:hypothetical protein